MNGSYPVHLLRDPQIPFEICEYVYNQTRKFFGPHEIPFESMVLSNAPIVDMLLNSPLQINHDENDFRYQDILTALQRLKDPSRVLVSMLNRSYRTWCYITFIVHLLMSSRAKRENANCITRLWNINRAISLFLGYAIDRHDARTQVRQLRYGGQRELPQRDILRHIDRYVQRYGHA